MDKRYNKKTGDLGETIATQYLINNNHTVLERNYRKPWAEIDIITQCNDVIHFVEVKTVSYETKAALVRSKNNGWQPEEQVHARKIHQIGKGAETWISERSYTGNWQIDVIAVKMVPQETYATVKYIENVIMD